MFRKILVANRGEIAVRIIRAAHALGVAAVAVYSEADKASPHVSEADESVCIGGPRSDESYLSMSSILQAAEITDSRAIHPGYGFLAENSIFTARCEQQKISFIGPSAKSIQIMGDKARAKAAMKRAGLPTIPGSEGIVPNIKEAAEIATEVGYPILLKATAGGGGKGMRICNDEASLKTAFEEASLEADKAFGNPDLYLEKFITSGRHIEFQFLADNFGNAIHLGERECSIQRKNQKLVEETPSVALSDEVRQELGAKVVRAVQEIGYVNAGTVEFFMDSQGKLYFMEMNTRLQVEHPITEMVTGIDIVQEQLKIAANYRMELKQSEISFSGHSIECRINAEDPEDNFRPNPGKITAFKFPFDANDASYRLDSHVKEGYTIPPYYDSLIGKLIVHGKNRDKAIEKMKEALTNATISGIKTTIPLHIQIMNSKEFHAGNYNTHFVPEILNL